MSSEAIIQLLDMIGVFVFALSGGLLAVQHRLDVFGVCVIAFMPAVGGGTLRDVLLDVPVFWLDEPIYLWISLAAGLLAFFAPRFWMKQKSLVWLDAIGLSLFSVIGAAKAHDLGHGVIVVAIMGTVTATAGGLIRDVICNEKPLLLMKEVYATAALLGALAYWGTIGAGVDVSLSLIVGVATSLSIRCTSIILKLNLPHAD